MDKISSMDIVSFMDDENTKRKSRNSEFIPKNIEGKYYTKELKKENLY